jgi:hypothetical protein
VCVPVGARSDAEDCVDEVALCDSIALGDPSDLTLGATARPAIRVAAVQMTAELGNVDANLANAERLVRLALHRGANW